MENIIKQIHKEFRESVVDMGYNPGILSKLKVAGFTKLSTSIDAQAAISMQYPYHQVIYDSRVTQLSKKYNLVLADMSKYIGFIPEKNLNEILEFRKQVKIWVQWEGVFFTKQKQFDSYDEAEAYLKTKKGSCIILSHKFQIVCPAKDLYLEEWEQIVDGKIIPDPIVLAKPIRNGNGQWDYKDYNIVVTAWGDEAKDVFNEKQN